MSKKVEVVSRGGIGFWSLLAIVLIALKLTGQIQISWWIIVGCMFAPLIILGLFLVGGFIVVAIGALTVAVVEFLSKRGKR